MKESKKEILTISVKEFTNDMDKASVEEELNLIIAEYPIYKLQGGTDSLEDFLLNKGADSVTNNVGTVDSIELYGPSGEQITGNLNGKTATFTVNSNGEYTTKVKATTDQKVI